MAAKAEAPAAPAGASTGLQQAEQRWTGAEGTSASKVLELMPNALDAILEDAIERMGVALIPGASRRSA